MGLLRRISDFGSSISDVQIKLTYPNILNLHHAGAGHICKCSNFGERNAGTLGTVGTLTKCCHKFYSRTGQNTIILEIIL